MCAPGHGLVPRGAHRQRAPQSAHVVDVVHVPRLTPPLLVGQLARALTVTFVVTVQQLDQARVIGDKRVLARCAQALAYDARVSSSGANWSRSGRSAVERRPNFSKNARVVA